MPTITHIPATKSRYRTHPDADNPLRRVAGYARVSTANEDQANSYAAQVDYYTHYINTHNGWTLAGIYTDEGISGTSTRKREGFQNMIADALAGKIDLIITKSVSRFARNTVDTLTHVRQLKDAGVEVYFEKENIWTLDSKGELLITIMSSLAQEESRSISENVTWGHRKRFADGKPLIPFSNMIGFTRNPDGSIGIDPDGANLVRRIYHLYLTGNSIPNIARILTADGIPTPRRAKAWSHSTIRSILTNEKYKGDALLQKGFTTDFLTKHRKTNEGEVPQYYVTGSHEAIINPDTWQLVQTMLTNNTNHGRKEHTFTALITCTHCGGTYGPKLWHSTNTRYTKTIWQCNNKYTHPHPRRMPNYTNTELEQAFQTALAALINSRELIDYRLLESTLADTADLEVLREQQASEIDVTAKLIEHTINTNKHQLQSQDTYRATYSALEQRHHTALANYQATCAEITKRQAVATEITAFRTRLNTLNKAGSFNPETFHTLTQNITASPDGKLTITFKNGTQYPGN